MAVIDGNGPVLNQAKLAQIVAPLRTIRPWHDT
jgi:hypothetical protein